ncbi:MAG: YggT family protein [Woeseiaceae bacterium]
MVGSFLDAMIFIVDSLVKLYLLIVLVRLMLPWMGVSFQNPLTQAVLKATSPLVIPIRRILPPIGKLDAATLIVAFGLQYLLNWLVAAVYRSNVNIPILAAMSAFDLLQLLITMYMFSIIIRIIISWVAPHSYNPAVGMLIAFTDPVLRPFRRMIPAFGPFDLSPLFAMLALGAIRIIVAGAERSVLGA